MGVMKLVTTGRGYRGAVDRLGDEVAKHVFAAAFAALRVEERGLTDFELLGRFRRDDSGLIVSIKVGDAVAPPEIVVRVPEATDAELAFAEKLAADRRDKIQRIGGTAA